LRGFRGNPRGDGLLVVLRGRFARQTSPRAEIFVARVTVLQQKIYAPSPARKMHKRIGKIIL
jgi:hypothetical protein